MCFNFITFRWSRATVAIAGKEFLPGYRLDPNAAFLDLMTSYSNEEKSTKKMWPTGFREDTNGKSEYNKFFINAQLKSTNN